jgi:hypothetical protein
MDVYFVVREMPNTGGDNERRVVSAHDCRWQAETAARVFSESFPVSVGGSARFVVERWSGLDR